MRSSQKNIVKMKKIDLDDAIIDRLNGDSNQINNNSNGITEGYTEKVNLKEITTRVEWNVSVTRPSFSVPDSNTASFYKNTFENLLKQTSTKQLPTQFNKVNTSVNALLSPRMNFRASKSLSTRESSITSTTEDEEGLVQINQYKVLNDLGRGAYGFVKLVEDQNGHLFALKIISKRKLVKSSGYFRRPPPLRNTSTSFCNENIRETVSQNSSPSRCIDKNGMNYNILNKSNQERKLWISNDLSNDSLNTDNYLDPLRRVYQEIAIYKKLDNPHIVKLHDVIDEPGQDNLYMIFEHIEGGPIMNVGLSDPLSEELARKYFRDILCGLDYLHYNKIIHRDIKPSNLLVDKNGTVKLIDFGVSCQFTGDDIFLQDTLGSPAFLAPECVQDCHGKFTGKTLDIWALGMTLYCLVFGKVAFDSRNKIDLYHSIATKPIILPQSPAVSAEARDLLNKMLNKLPKERITLNKIKEHPWVTENGKWSFPYQNQKDKQQIEVSDKEIDQCTVKPVQIQTIVSALMMARRRSFRNPKICFEKFLKSEEPHRDEKQSQNNEVKPDPLLNSDQLGEERIPSTSTENNELAPLKLVVAELDPAAPSGKLLSKPSTSSENIFKLKNIFSRLSSSSSESTGDDGIQETGTS